MFIFLLKCRRVFSSFIENKFLNTVPFCVLTTLLRAGLALHVTHAMLLSCNLLGCLISGRVAVMLSLQATSRQMVSATALLPHVHLKLLGRGLLQDSDHTGGKYPFCIRGVCFFIGFSCSVKASHSCPSIRCQIRDRQQINGLTQ